MRITFCSACSSPTSFASSLFEAQIVEILCGWEPTYHGTLTATADDLPHSTSSQSGVSFLGGMPGCHLRRRLLAPCLLQPPCSWLPPSRLPPACLLRGYLLQVRSGHHSFSEDALSRLSPSCDFFEVASFELPSRWPPCKLSPTCQHSARVVEPHRTSLGDTRREPFRVLLGVFRSCDAMKFNASLVTHGMVCIGNGNVF